MKLLLHTSVWYSLIRFCAQHCINTFGNACYWHYSSSLKHANCLSHLSESPSSMTLYVAYLVIPQHVPIISATCLIQSNMSIMMRTGTNGRASEAFLALRWTNCFPQAWQINEIIPVPYACSVHQLGAPLRPSVEDYGFFSRTFRGYLWCCGWELLCFHQSTLHQKIKERRWSFRVLHAGNYRLRPFWSLATSKG